MSDDVELKIDGLEKFIKALNVRPPVIKVGILAGGRNAEIGTIHEFGTSSIPQRSFLIVPLLDNLNKYLEKDGLFTKDALKEVIAEKSLLPWSNLVGISAVNVVLDAFETAGFGKWAKWKNPNYTNNTGMILQDTVQLRNSISYEVR